MTRARRMLVAVCIAIVVLGIAAAPPTAGKPADPVLIVAEPLVVIAEPLPNGEAASWQAGLGPSVRHVIVISIDGLRPDAIARVGEEGAPNLYRLMREGSFTLNARNLVERTITLPNHAGMVTGQRVALSAGGMGVTFNNDNGRTIHDSAGRYVSSVFDVVHDAGGSTAMFVGKVKFEFLDRSWDAVNGAEDVTGADDGRDKIDLFSRSAPATALAAQLAVDAPTFSFLHLPDPDLAGHLHSWMSSRYLRAVTKADAAVGEVLAAIDASTDLAENTVVILTSDHGGRGDHHDNVRRKENYTVPFLVWGAGVPAGADLYELNPGIRLDPGTGRPLYTGVQPIRNGEAANLALDLLGLPAVPGSLFDAQQDLEVMAETTG